MAALPKFIPEREVTWRPLADGDLAYVAALEAEIHAAPWTMGNFRDSIAAGHYGCVGERESRIVAYGVLLLGAGDAQLLNLSVVPDARREGLGRRLLHRFLADAARFGAEQFFLEVRTSNVPAISLYESEGFVPVGRRVAYYPVGRDGVREDALVMRRALSSRRLPDLG